MPPHHHTRNAHRNTFKIGNDMNIDSLEAVQLGDTTQWIRVRAEDPSNPVLLLIQQGPGLPMINEVRGFEATLGLEKDFIVVYWISEAAAARSKDQRATKESPCSQWWRTLWPSWSCLTI